MSVASDNRDARVIAQAKLVLKKAQTCPRLRDEEWLIALAFGDGHISPGGYLMLKHGKGQLDYLEWKVSILRQYLSKEISIKNSVSRHKNGKSFNQVNTEVYDNRLKHNFRDLIYAREGKKSIRNILDVMTLPEALCIWFMDDGNASCIKRNRVNGSKYLQKPKFHLSIHDSTFEEGELICARIKERYGVEGYVNWERKQNREGRPKYPRIWFNVENATKMWYIIRPFMPRIKSMQHKFRHPLAMFGEVPFRAEPPSFPSMS